ncbi:MAG: GIDE domain-containing protein [Gammaproteobacteria bacterium]
MIADIAYTATHAGAGEFWFAAGAALVIGSACAWGALTFLKRKRVIEDTPTALIRSAPQGYVELQGRAELMDGDEIFAPLSGRRCVWFSYRVEKREDRRSDGRNQSRWVTVEQGKSEDLFYLVDHTGRCAVDPQGAAVTPTHRNSWYGSSRIPGRYHESDGAWWARTLGQMGKRYRYTERRIEPGDTLYALGNFTTHGSGAAAFDLDGAVGDKLREWKRDQAFMLEHFDADGDGAIDMDEWGAARERAEAEARAEQAAGGQPPPVDLLAKTRDGRRPFVIHAGSEAEIVKRCQYAAAGLTAVGAPLLAVSLWTVVIRLGAG